MEFYQDPNNIPTGKSGICWTGGHFKDVGLIPNSNQFYTVSLFESDDLGKANRRKANFKACYVIALDDVKEKLPVAQVQRLPPPSIVLKSSLHSEQWLYLLSKPCSDSDKIDNLHDGLIKNGLAPDGRDPGQKGVTRYLRLPEGCNTKAKRIEENNGLAPQCEVVVWQPERKYSLEQLAKPFEVDINAPREDKRVDGATNLPDHPLLHCETINIKRTVSNGRFDITCPWIDEHTGADDSGTAVFTNSDGTIGFKCHHGSCEALTGKDLLCEINSREPGFNERLNQWQTVHMFSNASKDIDRVLNDGVSSPLDLLRSAVANGNSKRMRAQMNDDKFVLKDLAILGQWTVFYAGPNTGKTLLTQHLLKESISSGEIDGKKVFYANCDDTYKGGIEKLEIAEEFGYEMVIPNIEGFESSFIIETMVACAKENEANGVVIIIDTLKKLVDLMDKKTSTNFGKIAREFVGVGGSLICLAHVNKHKENGKSVHTGTADIRDDADCVFMIEHLGSEKCLDGAEVHTVQFECSKSRGDVAQSVPFQYTKSKGLGYRALLDSAQRIDDKGAEAVKQNIKALEKQKDDSIIIELIRSELIHGDYSKGDLSKALQEKSKASRRNIIRVLDEYSERLWRVDKGTKNTSIYKLIDKPLPPVSFL